MSDGILRVTTWHDIVSGTVLRQVSRDGTAPQFADCAIVAVQSDANGRTNVKIARPHLKVEGGHVWTCLEQFEVEGSRLMGEDSIFRTVCLDRGQAASVDYSR